MGRISLDSLCGGALLERVGLAMGQIGRNIMDPNTNPEKARKLTITITFKADKSRQHIKTSAGVNVSLTPPEATETLMLIGKDLRTGRIEISEYGNNQAVMRVGEATPTETEEIKPDRAYDSSTGEILEEPQSKPPIDLRIAN